MVGDGPADEPVRIERLLERARRGLERVAAQDLAAEVEAGALVVDVREAFEAEAGALHLFGREARNLPLSRLAEHLAYLLAAPARPT